MMNSQVHLLKLILDELWLTERCKTLDGPFYRTVRSIAKDMKTKGVNHLMYSECRCHDCNLKPGLEDHLLDLQYHLLNNPIEERYELHPKVKSDVQEYNKSESFQKIISSLQERQTL